MDNQIAFVYGLGGLISDAVLAELRADRATGAAKDLTEPSTFSMRDDSLNARQVEEDIELSYSVNEAAWNTLAASLDNLDVSRLRDRLLLPMLRTLGFDPRYQHSHLQGDDGKQYAITHLSWDNEDAAPLILTDQLLDHRTGRGRSPHQEMQAYLNAAPARWGMVANARELRILRDYHHTTTRGAIVIAVADLFEAGSFPDFRALYRLAHATRFVPDHDNGTLLERLYQASLSEGVKIGTALQPQVRRALNLLLGGFLAGDTDLRDQLTADPAFGRQLYGELLTILYRILFLIFAEQRGLLGGANETYRQSYSVTRLRDLAETRGVEARHEDLWEGLKAAFLAFSGDEELAASLSVHPYNGNLFDPERTRHLTNATCTNTILLDAVRALTTVQIGKVRQYVDYRHIGVEELGSVYESLLNYTIRIADTDITVDRVSVRKGNGYLAPLSIERSELGAYYTPPKLVDLTLSKALDDLIDRCVTDHPDDPAAQESALLDLKIIDPACGSAAFLVGAIDRVATPLADIRARDHAPTESDTQHARRDVLHHCIYGVDIDPFAVELAKVALWIHCAVDDLPLSFLDHKIVHGNSLVGWPLFNLPQEIPTDAYAPPSGVKGEHAQPYRNARNVNTAYLSQFSEHAPTQPGLAGTDTLDLETLPLPAIDIDFPAELLTDDRTVDDVRRKSDAYRDYVTSDDYRRLKAAADLWTAAFFWTPDNGTFPTSRIYHDALTGATDPQHLDAAVAVVGNVTPLHWPLTFPDVHHRGGFDLVIGNPPWEKFVTPEQEYFAAAGRFGISELTSASRKQAIAALTAGGDRDRTLHAAWVAHKAANDRMSDYAKESRRFTPVAGEVNTYVLFTELAADIAGDRGQVSIIVKSGIALDKTPSNVWRPLLESGRIRSVVDTINHGQGVFPAVAAVERFAVLTLGPCRDITSFTASMLNFSLDEAFEKEPIVLTADDVQVTNPHTMTLLSSPTKTRYDLAVSIHRRLPILDLEGANPWDIRYQTLFHSSGDSGLFLRRKDLESDGWVLGDDKNFRRGDETAVPVLEGQLVGMFDHRVKSYERYTGANRYGKKPNVPWTTNDEKADPLFEAEPRYWMRTEDAAARLDEAIGDDTQIAIRDVGAPWTNQRSARAVLIPRYPVTHTIPQLRVPIDTVHGFVGVYNSTAFDFIARAHMPSGHLAMVWLVAQLAAPEPGLDPRIGELSERLSVTSQRLAEEYGFTLHPWDPTQREADQTMLDALVAKTAYQLTIGEYETVLDSFDVMRRAEDAKHSEYRFKRLCLEAYDRI